MQALRFRLLTLLLLGGCAATYTPPGNLPSARIRFIVQDASPDAAMNAMIYPSGLCESPMELAYTGGRINQSDLSAIGMPTRPGLIAGRYFEKQIPASNSQLFSVRLLTRAGRCMVSFSMQPQPSRDYEAVVTWGERQCYVNVKELPESSNRGNAAAPQLASQVPVCSKGFN